VENLNSKVLRLEEQSERLFSAHRSFLEQSAITRFLEARVAVGQATPRQLIAHKGKVARSRCCLARERRLYNRLFRELEQYLDSSIHPARAGDVA